MTGFLLIITVFLIGVTGHVAFHVRQFKWNTNIIRRVRLVHKLVGYLGFFGSFAALSTGIYSFKERFRGTTRLQGNAFVLANLIPMISIYIFFELRFRKQRKEKVDYKLNLPLMTLEECQQNIEKGVQLWILDELVLDLTEYSLKHPGGRFVIQRTVGRDISKFFYGGYALDHNSNDHKKKVPSYTHSEIAKLVAQDCAVAILDRKDVASFNS